MLAKLKVVSVLESLPGVGKVRARKRHVEELEISESRRLRGLGDKQPAAARCSRSSSTGVRSSRGRRSEESTARCDPRDPIARRRGVLLVLAGHVGRGQGHDRARGCAEHDPGAALVGVVDDPRRPRPGEVDGVDYHFVTREEFERLRDAGGFLEWFEVYGDLKGTPERVRASTSSPRATT